MWGGRGPGGPALNPPLNFCHHFRDFGLTAKWTFFATSHGKSLCDGIEGTVKRLVARASLQRPLDDQILSMDKMYEFCESNITGIKFLKVAKMDMAPIRQALSNRFENGKTIPGTRGYHHFFPLSEGKISYKRVSDDEADAGTFTFFDNVTAEQVSDVKTMEFIACQYDSFWWVGLVEEINQEQKDFLVKFMHPHGPIKSQQALNGQQEMINAGFHLINSFAKLIPSKQPQEGCIR